MSRPSPSEILAIANEAYEAEARALADKAQKKRLNQDERGWLRDIHRDQAQLENNRATALLALLGASANPKDWTPQHLEAVSKWIMSGEQQALPGGDE